MTGGGTMMFHDLDEDLRRQLQPLLDAGGVVTAEVVRALRNRKIEVPPTSLGSGSVAVIADLAKVERELTIIPPAPRCPALLPDEHRCLPGGVHETDDLKKGRRCPLIKYLAERERLADALALCQYGHDRNALVEPVGATLLQSIDQARDQKQAGTLGVLDLRNGLARISEILAAGPGGACHVHLVGDTGTAKTMVLFGLYFSWLWSGAVAHWVVNSDLRTAARQRLSYMEDIQNRARDWLATMRRYPVLFLSDLGAQSFDRRAQDPGSTEFAGLLLDLLDNYSGRLLWDSNLDTEQLRKHADFGPRVVSRLMASRRGEPIQVIPLWGADQRQYGLKAPARVRK